jgi:hypothetical protein
MCVRVNSISRYVWLEEEERRKDMGYPSPHLNVFFRRGDGFNLNGVLYPLQTPFSNSQIGKACNKGYCLSMNLFVLPFLNLNNLLNFNIV